MKLSISQKVLVAGLTLWASIYLGLLCGNFSMFGTWLLLVGLSRTCLSAYCTPNPNSPVPVLGGLAGLVYNPLVILLNVALYIALIIFYFRLWRTRRGRPAVSKITAVQLDKGETEKEAPSTEE